MIDGLRIMKGCHILTIAALLVISSTSSGQELKSDEVAYRQYWVGTALVSLKPGEGLATYRGGPFGGAGPNGMVGSGMFDKSRRFEVEVTGKLKANRFIAIVKVTPDKEDTRTQAQEQEYDLSELKPRSLEIARDDDGRVYQLDLTPRIIEYPKPKPFKAIDLRLQEMRFLPSPVIVNDQDYVGEMNMSGGELVWCDIPGLAKIEFSLLHLKNASVLGTLKDGTISISHENGTTVKISNVKNGADGGALTGGPYQVWVRWKKPTQSIEEYHKSIKGLIAALKERVKNGESLPPGSLERIEKSTESERARIVSFGGGEAEPGDLVEPMNH